MPEDLIRYDILAQEALRGVVKKVLAEVARTGLPGAHHFYITFATRAPGVRISTPLLEKYPEEMTIVLQYAFRDLIVTDTAFEVGLSFGEVPERLLIPFAAIRAFLDPSVQFALHFEPQAAPEASESEEPTVDRRRPTRGQAAVTDAKGKPRSVPVADKAAKPKAVPPPADKPAGNGAAEVVSLDAFRKKN
ncbi:MAG: ClpXP protease specificity-enhancing factor SspB [Bauldia sp.]